MNSTSFQLRDYQLEAVNAVIAARKSGVRRMVIALPTGAGKTVIFSELIRRARHGALVLAHRKELLGQACDKIRRTLDDGSAAGRRRVVAIEQGNQHAVEAAGVIVASLRSLHAERMGRALAGRDIRLVIYDECHHAVAPENRAVLERLGVFEPDWPGTLVGCTATTRRADGKPLADVSEQIVFTRSLSDMIGAGYLRPLRGLRVCTRVDLSDVACLGGEAFGAEAGDFEPDALQERIDIESRNLLVARSIQELARDRRTIAFCVGVSHAENLARTLNHLGMRAAMVCGEMPTDARTRTLSDFRRGAIRVITNVGVLTEGFDDPGVSAVAMVRPTRSQATYLQCIGRGMRVDPSATDCLVLDFVDLGGLDVVGLPTLLGSERPEQIELGQDEALLSGGRPPPEINESEVPLTLTQIRERTAAFDPLIPELAREVAAISANAWISLGARGLLLQFRGHNAEIRHFELRSLARGRYAIELDGVELLRCANIETGVESVDHELARYGSSASARADAPWRRAAVPDELAARLRAMRPPRWARSLGEAMEHLALASPCEAGPRRASKR